MAVLTVTAHAIEAAPEPLEEVIVTATKREVSIQKVPVSILAIDGQELSRNALSNLEQYSRLVPNLLVGDALITTAVSIRGVGSLPERGFEQSVGLFVDGVYMPRSRQYRASFLDVERVEVMRGPQAVLHGLNSTAGAVSVVTGRTHGGDPFSADVTGEYEAADGGYRLTAVLAGSPSDSLGLRLAARAASMNDFFRNDATGKDEGGSKEASMRLSAAWQPIDDLLFDFKIEHGSMELDGSIGEQWGPDELNQLLLLGLDAGDDGKLNWRRDMDASFQPILSTVLTGRNRPGMDQDYSNLVLDTGYDLKDHRLSMILAHSNSDWSSYTDGDASALPVLDMAFDETFKQDSAEFRLTSQTGGRFDYIAGLYFLDNRLENRQGNIFEPTLTVAPGAYGFDHVYTASSFQRDTQLFSMFASGTYHLNDLWHFTLGMRYSDEKKDYARQSTCLPVRDGIIDFDPSETDKAIIEANGQALLCATLDGYNDSRQSDNWMPEASLRWDMNDDIQWYGKYASSAKSGGWVASTIAIESLIEYDDESASSWELGMRSYLHERTLSLNMAVFHSRFDDMQVNAFDPATASAGVINAAEAKSQGFEADLTWQAADWLSLFASYAYLDAKYEEFEDAECPISEQLAGTPPPCDASGKRLPMAPEHSIGFRADIRHALASGPFLLAGLNIGYNSEYFSDAALEPALVQDACTTWGARLGVEAADGRWLLSVVGTNLGNETVLTNTQPFLSTTGYLRSPRRIWLQGSWRFGE